MTSKRAILVIGGSGSLGKAVTAAALDRGLTVALAGRDLAKLELLGIKNVDGTPAKCFQVDLRQPESVSRCAADIKGRLPALSGVINCAAGFYKGNFASMSQENIVDLIATTFTGIVLLINRLLPTLTDNAPSDIINVTSISSATTLDTSKSSSLHIAAKSGLHTFDAVLGRELASASVRVTTVAPGTFAKENRDGIPVTILADLIVKLLEIPSSIRIETLIISPNG
jgi:NAD(P)-dependent dehydrogenase (short-subunit alcohol dehydrogenase family)